MISEIIEYRTRELIERYATIPDISLGSGKAGILFYLFALAHRTGNEFYREQAEQWLDDVFEGIDRGVCMGFIDGVEGIAWVISRLLREGEVEGDPDWVLREADDRVYREITQRKVQEPGEKEWGHLVYLLERLQTTVGAGEMDRQNRLLREEAVIGLFNDCTVRWENSAYESVFQEPLVFSLWNYRLPLLLQILSFFCRTGFYTYKAHRVALRLRRLVCSAFPALQSHRFSLYVALSALNFYVEFPEWNRHLSVLRQTIDGEQMFAEEFNGREMGLERGMGGILFLLKTHPEVRGEEFHSWIPVLEKRLENRLSSLSWEKQEGGLARGVAGTLYSCIL